MANTNKTKAEILQELESIKGLLQEEDDIPILRTIDETLSETLTEEIPAISGSQQQSANPAVLPGQTSLFDEEPGSAASAEKPNPGNPVTPERKPGFAAHLKPGSSSFAHSLSQSSTPANRTLAKASGENPFLPQHIRERLHGNNPPPLFEYETAKKILSATKNIANKINKPRQTLVEEVISGLMPTIEAELRHRLYAMSVEDLEKLLNEDEE
jgi:hypothetical protein